MSVKTLFSIKDLENLSGVKAHTIRIWEKRYHLLEPQRTDTNIRQYDVAGLKRLLNVSFLYHKGYKISKIANFKESEINGLIQEIGEQDIEHHALQSFKAAMFDFDHYLFSKTYQELLKHKSFTTIFYDVFIPLLSDIGTLWQTGTIDPAHERFISEIVKQEIIVNIHAIQQKRKERIVPKFALFLPYEEIHEIGLLFANYEILAAGFNTIYLGNNIPMESLKHLLKHYQSLIFLSYFTVKPDHESVWEYMARFNTEIGTQKNSAHQLWLMGSKIQQLKTKGLPQNVSIIYSLKELNQLLKTFES
ncbi:MAG: MerR family transcriptional regulator [Flavobacteriaceae bacterium]